MTVFFCLKQGNILLLVPAMAARLVKYPMRYRFDLSSVRAIHSGAAPLGIGLENQLKELFKVNYIANGKISAGLLINNGS